MIVVNNCTFQLRKIIQRCFNETLGSITSAHDIKFTNFELFSLELSNEFVLTGL